MPQDGEQSQQRRRSKAITGGSDPMPLLYPIKTKERSTSAVPSIHEEGYPFDEGLIDKLRPNTSVVRLDNPQSAPKSQRTTNAQPSPPPVPPRRQQAGATKSLPIRQPRMTEQPPIGPPKLQESRNMHWLVYVGVGMLAMIVLWLAGSSALAWGIVRYNDIRYGTPRTYQTDAVVGHGGDSTDHPSHFVAINLHRQAVVIELMAGDPAKTVTYLAPIYIVGNDGDLAPVTLEFRDVTGDGKVDMIIHIHLSNQDQISVFVNDGTKFRPSTGNDKLRI